jgi:two-component system sensor histidine kinase RegB
LPMSVNSPQAPEKLGSQSANNRSNTRLDLTHGRTSKGLGSGDQFALLRSLAWLLQLLLVFVGEEAFGLSLQLTPITWVLGLALGYLLVTLWYRKPLFLNENSLFTILFIDTLFWIAWLYFSGGATNAFISLLLLPIALAAVTLPLWAAWSLTALSTLAYSLMIFFVPSIESTLDPSALSHIAMGHGSMTDKAMDMTSHYLGMWLNFVVSALALTTSVALIARRMRRQDAELAYHREAQLTQEQLLALGTASAQMAHQLATPLSSLRLLLDEAKESAQPLAEQVNTAAEMDVALGRCEHTLKELRLATENIRTRRITQQSLLELLKDLTHSCLLFMPQAQISWPDNIAQTLGQTCLNTDPSVVPALMSLIENGVRASLELTQVPKVTLELALLSSTQGISLRIRDFGQGISPELLSQLGDRLVQSPKGLGAALLLSHASFERLGGRLILAHHPQGGTVAEVCLPIADN